jgi:branched-chain amino acid transport system substrate-binding protein
MKKLLVMLFIGCLVCGFSSFAYSDQGVTKDTIKIGHLVDLTGISALWGTISKQNADMWAAEVNSKGGIHGRKIEMVYGDNQYRADQALSEVKRLVDFEKVFCFVGGQNTPTNMVAAPYAASKGVPWLFPMNSLMMYEQTTPYIYNFCSLHRPLTKIAIDYAVEMWKPKKFGVFYQYDEYGRTELKHIEEQLAKYGLKVHHAEYFKMGALNVSSEVARLKSAGCDVVFMLSYTNVTANFLKDARRIGFKPHIITGTSSANDNCIKLAEGAAEGVVFGVWYRLEEESCEGWDQLKGLMKKYHPDKKTDQRYCTWLYWPAIQHALELAGPNLTTETLQKALDTGFKGWTNGMMGPIYYGPDNHKASNYARLIVVKNGKFVGVPGWSEFRSPKFE